MIECTEKLQKNGGGKIENGNPALKSSK